MKQALKKSGARLAGSKKARFGMVGIVNTVVDFAVLSLLVDWLGVPLVAANVVSTTAAMLTSFTLNKKAVFRDSDMSGSRQFLLFMSVTLAGVWIVQSTVLTAAYHLLQPTGLHAALLLNVAKLAGIAVGMIWNYFWYSRVVFRETQRASDE